MKQKFQSTPPCRGLPRHLQTLVNGGKKHCFREGPKNEVLLQLRMLFKRLCCNICVILSIFEF